MPIQIWGLSSSVNFVHDDSDYSVSCCAIGQCSVKGVFAILRKISNHIQMASLCSSRQCSDAMNTSNVNGGSNRRVPNCNARHASNTPPWHACPGHQFSPSRNTWKKPEGAQYMLPLRVYPYHKNGCLLARIPSISPSDIHMSFDA